MRRGDVVVRESVRFRLSRFGVVHTPTGPQEVAWLAAADVVFPQPTDVVGVPVEQFAREFRSELRAATDEHRVESEHNAAGASVTCSCGAYATVARDEPYFSYPACVGVKLAVARVERETP